jgi:AraC-like DNA-binding protein
MSHISRIIWRRIWLLVAHSYIRKMKDNLNISPSEFILGYRMLVAENLLKSTDMTISEIINRCGFHNRAYFYREFSKRHHCLPKDFRKNG